MSMNTPQEKKYSDHIGTDGFYRKHAELSVLDENRIGMKIIADAFLWKPSFCCTYIFF